MLLKELLEGYNLILASQSPRRKMLFEGLDVNFKVLVRDGVDEIVPDGLSKKEIPGFLAKHKSNFYTDLLNEKTILITADTIVWCNNQLIGKPHNLQHAKEIIKELSGQAHEVITGVCLRSANKIRVFHSLSEVVFAHLTDDEIRYYVEKYNPMDKAGAYGIQEWIGYIGIEKIEGSFYNVMGLPVRNLYKELMSFVSS